MIQSRFLKQANALVWTGDGSEISNIKISRAYNALAISEQNEDVPILNRTVLIYNKFSNKSSRALASNIELKNIGGAPRYEHASVAQILDSLSSIEMFGRIC